MSSDPDLYPVFREPSPSEAEFVQLDGSTYQRVAPEEFDSFDEVDSTTIDDDGAPE